MSRATTARFIPSIGFALLALFGLAMAAVAAGCQTRQAAPAQTPEQQIVDPAHAERVEPSRPLGDAGAIGARSPRAAPPDEPRPDRRPSPRPAPLPEQNPVPDPTPEPMPEPSPSPSGR